MKKALEKDEKWEKNEFHHINNFDFTCIDLNSENSLIVGQIISKLRP